MTYRRSPAPKEYEPGWIDQELEKLELLLQGTDSFRLKEWHVEPPKPRRGDVYLADGVDWDPGNGQGAYLFDGSGFVLLGFDGVIPANSVGSAQIVNGSIITEDLADDAVTTAKIANDQVTFAKLANIATQRLVGRNTASSGDPEEVTILQALNWLANSNRGDLIRRGASDWETVNLGSSGQVLTSDGTDAVWGSAPGGITTIASGNLPAAATQPVTNIPATYSHLIIQLTGASSNTATRQPLVQVSTNNGSSYDSTVGNYIGFLYDNSVFTIGPAALASLMASATAAAAVTFTTTILLWGYQSGPQKLYTAITTLSSGITYVTEGKYIGSTSPIDAIQFLWNGSGNFDAGTYAVYGVN